MDQAALQKLLKAVESPNDVDAVMGLRGLSRLLETGGITVTQAVEYAVAHIDDIRGQSGGDVVENTAKPRGELQVSGMPQCVSPRAGVLQIVPPGAGGGELVALPGAAANDSGVIAASLKDALVAAVINKSRLKLKLKDMKDGGMVVETILQAEYEREGMAAIPIWGNTRGEAGALATVLRRSIAASMPDVMA